MNDKEKKNKKGLPTKPIKESYDRGNTIPKVYSKVPNDSEGKKKEKPLPTTTVKDRFPF